MSLTLFAGRHLLHVHFVTGLESNLCAALTRYNTTENIASNNWIDSPSPFTAGLRPNVFLAGIYHLLVIRNKLSDLPSEPTTKVKVVLQNNQYKPINYQSNTTCVQLITDLCNTTYKWLKDSWCQENSCFGCAHVSRSRFCISSYDE